MKVQELNNQADDVGKNCFRFMICLSLLLHIGSGEINLTEMNLFRSLLWSVFVSILIIMNAVYLILFSVSFCAACTVYKAEEQLKKEKAKELYS